MDYRDTDNPRQTRTSRRYSRRSTLADASYSAGTNTYVWYSNVPTWAEGDSVAVKLIGPQTTPNAYGYRTIWNALMTAGQHTSDTAIHGYYDDDDGYGSLTNNMIVDGRDETVVIGTRDQPRYPWSGVEISGEC